MATTSNRLTDLYREALESVTATPENWLRFLQSAGRNYRYPFQDQLLIHHQRPDAIAVLEFSQWERRFHRGIRRGSTGIAVFGRSNGRTHVRYLFDIQDTNERTNSIPVPLWNVESGDHGPLLHMLEQKFSATEPVLPIAVMTTAKQYTSAVVSLRWEELQKAQVPVTQEALERLVENSVAYLLLCRMGLEDYAIFYPQDFDALEQFRSPQNIHLLGDAVNMASRDILTEVAATVRAEHLGQPTFFAEEPKNVYDEPTKEQNTHEGGQNHDDELSHRERLEPSEPDTAPGDTRNREVRPDAGAVPDRAPAQPVPDPADQRDTEPAPDGGAAAGGGNAGAGHEENVPAGAAEAGESYGVDSPDEQPEAQHRGNDLPDADYQLNIFGDTQEPEQSGSFVLPQAEIDQILRYGSITAGSRGRIFSFYQNHPSAADAAKFLKEEYGYSGHSYSFLDGSRGFVSYAPSTGLSIEHSESHTKTKVSWKSMEQRLRLMIREGTYLTPEEQMQYVSDHLEDSEGSEATPEEPSRVDEMLQQAEPPAPTTNFRITDDNLGCGSIRQKFANNLSAIRLLKSLEEEGRNATPEEQEILSRYVGWGGMPQAFDPENTSWSSEYTQLKELLEDEEYKAARESVLNAHYTSPTVIRGIYEAIGRMGFTTGNILEPACGVGNFFGMLPDTMQNSKLYGVELDSISGRIAKQLYPNADITVAGFETTDRRNFYDLAIGNVPFGNYLVDDKSYNSLGFRIHNYFFAKALDQVRPGGVVVFVTSRYTMDSKSTEVRKYLAQRAELLGAIRLPNNAFLANAGTSVVSDILFLQKRQRMVAMEPEWVHLDKTEDGITLNRYFVLHPEMVLGELSTESTQYGREECTVRPIPSAVLSQQLHEAVQHICGTYVEVAMDEAQDEQEDFIPADPNVKNYSFTVVDGTVYYRENSRMHPTQLSETAAQRVRGLIGLRNCVRSLITLETEDRPEPETEAKQAELNQLYDAFQQDFGLINSQQNRRAFSDDDSYYLLCSLEILDEERQLERKADIFTKRTIRPKESVTHVETAQEALTICLNDLAAINMDYLSQLTGKDAETLEQELSGQIYRLPDGNFEAPTFVLAEEYLSGNVREKLREAKAAAEQQPIYQPNVTALEQVQPEDLSPAEISVRLGSTWMPESDIQQFVWELLQPPWYMRSRIKVHYSPYTGAWQIEGRSVDSGSIYASSTYGTQRVSGYHILEDCLNLREVKVFDYVEVDGKRKAILNKKETAIAQGKQAEIKQAFQDWIWKAPDRRERLTTLYNERFNNLRPREYDGSHLIFPGMNPEITLRPHQKNAIARALYGGNTLLAHCVGAGKTFELVAIAQESKRLGLCHKSMVVVPNHLIGQWASEYLQLYPAANILVATEKDFTPARRKTFCSRISTGDYDAVIIGHSQFEKIPLSKERQTMLLERQIEDIVQGISEAKQAGGDRFTIKQMERSRKSIEAKLKKLNDQSRKDDVITFEELGVDRLLVDEAHLYKNLAAVSKMQNVAGISQTESQKASDMYLKCQYLDELTDGHGIVFATGTPISNSMVELYTMQRYLQSKTLEYYGFQHFDAWAVNFGETVTAMELSPEGTGYRTKTRFARFYNLPELIYMFRLVADIQTAEMLKLPVPKANYHVEQLEPSALQRAMVKELSARADKVRNKMVDAAVDNMLKITSDGRKLALDQRLMNPMLPDDEHSKTAACAKNVYDIWEKTADQRGTQIVFCDLSAPHFDGSFNVYDDLRSKLTEMGIPKEEIAFIHEAPTDVKKKKLFQEVRSGQVRVLLGSTSKMGTGTNVQTRLAANHDLDCPWRPSDLEQRSGRIIRQGNLNDQVDIYRYVTKETFDSYNWQIIETKQRFISQIMVSKVPSRTMEEADEMTMSYAEIKALTTGNPLIKEKMDLDVAVSRLTLLRSSFLSQKYNLENKLHRYFPAEIQRLEQKIQSLTDDLQQVKATATAESGALSPMEIDGITYTEKKPAGTAILAACERKTTVEEAPLGSYRGFSMGLMFDSFQKEFQIILHRQLSYPVSLGNDALGNLQRIDNLLDGLEGRLTNAKRQLETTQEEMRTAKQEAEKEFPKEQELREKAARLQELNSLLNMDERNDTVLEDSETETEVLECSCVR